MFARSNLGFYDTEREAFLNLYYFYFKVQKMSAESGRYHLAFLKVDFFYAAAVFLYNCILIAVSRNIIYRL